MTDSVAPAIGRPVAGAGGFAEWRRLVVLVPVIAAILILLGPIGVVGLPERFPPREAIAFLSAVFVEHLLTGALIVLAVVLSERVPVQEWRRVLLTVAAGIALPLTVKLLHYYYVGGPGGLRWGVAASPLALLLHGAWVDGLTALIVRAWLVRSLEEADARRLLARIRESQAVGQRRLVEARLKATQARVDPAFFFRVLEALPRAYGADLERGDALLDALTDHLRAALMPTRNAVSTVRHEFAIVGGFVRLNGLAGFGDVEMDARVSPETGAARFPTGLLLPLVAASIAGADAPGRIVLRSFEGSGAPAGTGGVDPASASTPEPRAAAVFVRLSSPRAPPEAARAAAVEMLVHLYGADASCTVDAEDGLWRTTIRIPREDADGPS